MNRSPPRMRFKFIKGPPIIKIQRVNKCKNRKFFRLAVVHANLEPYESLIEDLGSYDPMPNRENQIVVSLNLERIRYWMGKGVQVRGRAAELLSK